MHKQSFSTEIGGKTLTADFTDLTSQAHGSVILRYGETAILVTAVMNERDNPGLPYFPLSVEFEEKFYAAGQILGSRFQRREGRPSDEAVLSARVVDRTIRPLFDHTIRREVQVVITVLAMGEEDPDTLGVIGASLALATSDIPWDGPIGAVRIGQRRDTGEIVVNPSYDVRDNNELHFEVLACGKGDTINMVETAAEEIPESDIITVLKATTEVHTDLVAWQNEIVKTIGKEKRTIPDRELPTEMTELFASQFKQKLYDTIFSNRAGKDHIHVVRDEFISALGEIDVEINSGHASEYFENMVDELLHEGVLKHHKRADGRKMNEVRELYAQAGGISPVLHGSGIFYRGATHIFTALTLGGPDAAQLIDTIESQDSKKRFMHHYNFPPFSVGETGRVGGFNRRMIGHGALAEKALMPVLPKKEDFPYTIRLVSETMSSNGSSSMGSVCASTLAMMDGGVPITRPVAGIASGLMMDEVGNYVVLTDIQGPEDEHGDMDFKVAGTTEGVTAIQMDVKVGGVPVAMLAEALESAKAARLHILKTMSEAIAGPRAQISPRAPKIVTLNILPEQIGLVIGGGGKTINGIKDETGVEEISIEDDGSVFITGKGDAPEAAAKRIRDLTRVFVIGEQLEATITKIADFGAFARLNEQTEGLIHVSEIAPFRIDKVEDVLKVGDIVPVAVSKIENGKVGLSIKAVAPNYAKDKGVTPPPKPNQK